MKVKWSNVFSISFTLFCILFCVISASAASSEVIDVSEEELRTYAKDNNTWVLSYQQGSRSGDFYQYDATSKCIYFSYSLYSCVDVYDINGTFLYSFLFPDRQNGCISVRCENELVYISSKDGALHVFDGTKEIKQMTQDVASRNGYGFSWFDKNTPCVVVDKQWISWYSDAGEIIKQIKTPAVVKETIPPSKSMVNLNLILMVFIMLYALLYYAITIIRKKS